MSVCVAARGGKMFIVAPLAWWIASCFFFVFFQHELSEGASFILLFLVPSVHSKRCFICSWLLWRGTVRGAC